MKKSASLMIAMLALTMVAATPAQAFDPAACGDGDNSAPTSFDYLEDSYFDGDCAARPIAAGMSQIAGSWGTTTPTLIASDLRMAVAAGDVHLNQVMPAAGEIDMWRGFQTFTFGGTSSASATIPVTVEVLLNVVNDNDIESIVASSTIQLVCIAGQACQQTVTSASFLDDATGVSTASFVGAIQSVDITMAKTSGVMFTPSIAQMRTETPVLNPILYEDSNGDMFILNDADRNGQPTGEFPNGEILIPVAAPTGAAPNPAIAETDRSGNGIPDQFQAYDDKNDNGMMDDGEAMGPQVSGVQDAYEAFRYKQALTFNGLLLQKVDLYYDSNLNGHMDEDEHMMSIPIGSEVPYPKVHVTWNGLYVDTVVVYDDRNMNGHIDDDEAVYYST